MTLTKNQFFILLFLVFIGPFLACKLVWLANSERTLAEMRYVGHGDLGSALGISTYPVLRFMRGRDTFYVKGNINMDLKRYQKVPMRYQKNDPTDARFDTFVGIWMDALSYALMPFLVLLTLYIMPDRLDPIIPGHSKIVLGKKPFIRVIKPGEP